MRVLRAFGRFWYDFLIGERPELFVGPLVTLALVWFLVRAGWPDALAGVVLVGGVMVVAGIALARSLRPRR